MADAKVVKRLIADAVFPEMVKKGFYLSFEEKGETGFDFVATAKTEVQDGAIVNTWAGDAEERIKVFVCDREYANGMLEFLRGDIVNEIFCGMWHKPDFPNVILIVRRKDCALEFGWIRLRDFLIEMDRRCLTLRHFKDDFREGGEDNVTFFSGHPGELVLHDKGEPDRVLLAYDTYFGKSEIRHISLPLAETGDAGLGWDGMTDLPGLPLQTVEELDVRLKGKYRETIEKFKGKERGAFALGLAVKAGAQEEQFNRVAGTVACIISDRPEITQLDLINSLSRRILPVPMCGWTQSVAVQYKAMLDEEASEKERLERESALTDNSGVACVDQDAGELMAETLSRIEKLEVRALRAQENGQTIKAMTLLGQAAAAGGVRALKNLTEQASEIGETLVDEIEEALRDVVMNDRDRGFVCGKAQAEISELTDDDYAKLLRIALGHGILQDVVESIVSHYQEGLDAMNPDWMYPNGIDEE